MTLTIETDLYPGIMLGVVLERSKNRITFGLPFVMISIKYKLNTKGIYSV